MTKKRSAFKAGMYLLETLTAGMYNDPLAIYREYIQNAVDSIDLAKRENSLSVKINIDPIKKKISFSDNGIGIPSETAESTLSSIGSSNKINKGMRGFRGIGRLGGLAFCDKTIFRTKARGEKIESVQEWDCKKLRQMLSNPKNKLKSLKKVFDETTNYYQKNSKTPQSSYFKVELERVTSFRNYIFDLKKVNDYLSKVAPAPFNLETFQYGNEITKCLEKNLESYSVYNIVLNGHQVYKPYKENVKTTTKGNDSIDKIQFFELKSEDENLGYGWYGVRKKLIGAIAKGEKSSGVRVRHGNILIGDDHLLDGCFRESRFNSYIVGEIHVTNPNLIPNSRRDDFIDNDTKTIFYNTIVKEIGLPLSKEIRLRSRIHSQEKEDKKNNNENPDKFRPNATIPKSEMEKILERSCENCPNLEKILSELNS